MLKKIVLIIVFVLFASVLIIGAVNRTTAKSETETRAAWQHQDVAERNSGDLFEEEEPASNEKAELGRQAGGSRPGQDQGSGAGGSQFSNRNESAGLQQGEGRQGQGAGAGQQNGYGSGNGGQGQGWRKQQAGIPEAQEWITIEGVIVQAPTAGVDMILDTGEEGILIGTGPGYLDEQGFLLFVGDPIRANGNWENEEFKTSQITRLSDGTTIMLRDEWGRPMWSGAARNGQNNQGGGQAGG